MKGIQKVYWREIAAKVKTVAPMLFQIVEKISPGFEHPLYLCAYEYGDIIGDRQHVFVKDKHGHSCPLGSDELDTDTAGDLIYGIHSSPLMLFLEKNVEWTVQDKKNQRYIPTYLEKPGFITGITNISQTNTSRRSLGAALMTCTAGSSSSFMLPNIGNQKGHAELQHRLDILSLTPKQHYEHGGVFRELAKAMNSSWRTSVLYFSQSWVDSIKNDKSWIELQQYLLSQLLLNNSDEKDRLFYDYAFSRAQLFNNIVESQYLSDTAKHIIGITAGGKLGFSPVVTEESVPLKEIQEAYSAIYQLKYHPLVIEPTQLDLTDEEQKPVYYSLQMPTLHSFCKPNRYEPTMLKQTETLKRIMDKYCREFTSEDEYYKDTYLFEACQQVKLDYFHHQGDRSAAVKSSAQLIEEDSRFTKGAIMELPIDATFFRGCVKLSV